MTLDDQTRRLMTDIRTGRVRPQTSHVEPSTVDGLSPQPRSGGCADHVMVPQGCQRTEHTVAGDSGNLSVRVYRPTGRAELPGMLFLHGGGWTSGDLDSHDALAHLLSARLDAVIVTVAYRLAPEHPYPAAVDDAEVVLAWMQTHAEAIGADPEVLGIGGDSAGGNIAAGLCHRLVASSSQPGTKLDEPRCGLPTFQVLLYPALDAPSGTGSYADPECQHYLTRDQMDEAWQAYAGAAAVDPPTDLAPLRDMDFGGLPPTYLLTADCDPLRDEGREYVGRLSGAGVETSHHDADGVFHGFLRYADRFSAGRSTRESALQAIATVIEGAHRGRSSSRCSPQHSEQRGSEMELSLHTSA